MSSSHGHSEGVAHGAGEGHMKHMQPFIYWQIYGVLMVLLVLTVVMYYVDLSIATHWVGMNLVVALIIAVVKAALVVLYFMNVRNGTKLVWLWAGLGFIWLLLMSGVYMDYLTRGALQPHGWVP